MKHKLCNFSVCSAWVFAVLCLTPILGPAQTPTLNSQQLAFLSLINNFRAQNGAGALQVSVDLENSSQWMSNDMATKNYFSHTDSLGRDPFTRMAAFGYPLSGAEGENIAAGYGDAQSTFNQWETACDPDSTGTCTYAHRQNMLNPAYVVIGIGYAYNPSSTYRYYWTTDFGSFLDQTINLNSNPAPTIASFTVLPSAISSGQLATLTWSVSGATSVSLNNGIGDVSTVTSFSVSPAQTTTYTLTATNSGGSATATAILTVNPPPDTQPPSAPVIVSAVAKSAGEVDLAWGASVDNVGVAGYQIIRNGTVLASVSGATLSYADTGVSANSTYTYALKAYDAAGNFSTASNSVQVTTPPIATAPPPPAGSTTSIWPASATPAIGNMSGGQPVELGVKFHSDVSGQITGIRLYKGRGVSGTHTGSLWTSTGTLLATGVFNNETSSGWQVMTFASPVAISANTVYVASYHTDTGSFSVNLNYFLTQGVDNAPLHAPLYGVDGPNGVFQYSSGGQFPIQDAFGNNYWVDVLFSSSGGTVAPPPAPVPQSIVVAGGSPQSATVGTGFAVNLQAEVLDSSSAPMSGITVTFTAPSSGASASFAGGASTATALTNSLGIATAPALTANTITGTYSVAASVAGLPSATFALTNTAASTPPTAPPSGSGTATSIWPASATPAIGNMSGGQPAELGVKFHSDVAGQITGIRFYKGRGVSGTHTGSLWTSTGTLLATGTFTNETSSGWQVMTFTSPVAISANTVYVASYHTDTGSFSVNLNYFLTTGVDNAPLHAPLYGLDGPNGVFTYSTGGQFPLNDAFGNNYWVDVVFQH